MKQQLLKWWPVLVGVCAALAWVISSSMEVGALRADTEHHQANFKSEDARIHQRINLTNKKVTRLEKKVETTAETAIRLETNQSVIIKNQERILNRLGDR